MSKRKLATLTGGTNDINPQWFSFIALQTGNDVPVEISADLPINPSQISSPNEALIIECLKVQFIWSVDATQSPSNPQRWSAGLYSRNPATGVTLSSAQQGVSHIISDQFQTTQAGAGSTVVGFHTSRLYDITDGAGHGVVLATKAVTCLLSTLNTQISNRVVVRILYRYKRVGLTEFLTLAQFQS